MLSVALLSELGDASIESVQRLGIKNIDVHKKKKGAGTGALKQSRFAARFRTAMHRVPRRGTLVHGGDDGTRTRNAQIDNLVL